MYYEFQNEFPKFDNISAAFNFTKISSVPYISII